MIRDELVEIGNALAAFRKSSGMTQSNIAEKAQIHRQQVSDIERGKFTGSLTILLRYTQVAGLELKAAPAESEFPTLDSLAARYGS